MSGTHALPSAKKKHDFHQDIAVGLTAAIIFILIAGIGGIIIHHEQGSILTTRVSPPSDALLTPPSS